MSKTNRIENIIETTQKPQRKGDKKTKNKNKKNDALKWEWLHVYII